MKNVIYTVAAAGATVLVLSTSAKAELIYGFNDTTLNGFSNPVASFDLDGTATVSESTMTGVTEGTGALHINIAPTGGGYDQVDVVTSSIPADLVAPGTTSVSLDAAANYNNAGYITVAPEFYLDGTTDGTTAFGTKFLLPSVTLPYDNGVTTDHTDTFSTLVTDYYATARPANYHMNGQPATPADGDSTTAKYTPGQIASAILAALQAQNPAATASIDSFGIEETTNTDSGGGPTDLGDDLYVDNVTVPTPAAVPEPASLGVLALGGLLLARRRSAN